MKVQLYNPTGAAILGQAAPDARPRAPGLVKATPAPGQVAIERRRGDLQALRHVGHCDGRVLEERAGDLLVRGRKGGGPATGAPTHPGRRKVGVRPLPDNGSFKFCPLNLSAFVDS